MISAFLVLRFHEVKGHYPLMKGKATEEVPSRESSEQGETEARGKETSVVTAQGN